MKNSYIIILIFAILVVACTSPTEGLDAATPGTTQLSIECAPATRTAIGGTSTNGYMHHWQTGDCISINGTTSEAAISSTDARRATFEVAAEVKHPYALLHPASTSGRVAFPASQSYYEGTFDPAALLMYGYVEEGNSGTLNHLCSILRFRFTGSATLSKMVITAAEGALTGEYTIDCRTGVLSEAASTAQSVEYLFDKGLALSADKDAAKPVFVALPAGEYGECNITLHDNNGGSMRLRFNTADRPLRAGVVREFQSVEYREGASATLTPLETEEGEFEINNVAQGYVRYSDGSPIIGVAVSDGFQVCVTDNNGFYNLTPTSDTRYIYISLPADCKVPINEHGQPDFFRPWENGKYRYDFTLESLKGGIEEQFVLYTLGDPQVPSDTSLKRFSNETIPAIRAHVEKHGSPSYAITLGDIVSSGNSTDTSPYMEPMRNAMAYDKSGLPIFQVMGNHDFKGSTAVAINSTNSTLELAAQRTFESIFGPVNYSFNRGKVHIVGMRNTIYKFDTNKNNSDYASYTRGFTDAQYEWLRQDLAAVPKDRMVILCVHQPLYGQAGKNYKNIDKVFALLSQFKEAHIMSGHTHDVVNTTVAGYPIKEHVMGATCGAWWKSNLCKDGAPNGFGVYCVDGTGFANAYYQGTNEGFNDRNFQIQLFRGTAITGGSYEYFVSPYNKNTLIAHVWFYHPGWEIEVYLDGKKLGNMTKLTRSKGDPWAYDSNGKSLSTTAYNNLKTTIKEQTSTGNPTQFMSGSTINWWAIGYHIGVKACKRSTYLTSADNIFKFESSALASADWSKIKVVAIDNEYNNRYECSTVIQGCVGVDFDYSEVVAPTW